MAWLDRPDPADTSQRFSRTRKSLAACRVAAHRMIGVRTMLAKATEMNQPLPHAAELAITPRAEEALDLHTPPEIAAEVLIELMASLRAQLARLAEVAPDANSADRFMAARWAIRDMRTAFDPHDRVSVQSMRQRMLRYAEFIDAGVAPPIESTAFPE